MKPKLFFALLVLIIASALLAVVSASAQGGLSLDWWTVDGGGTNIGGGYSLDGTIGQADAGVMSGGGFRLSGGFWPGGEAGLPPGHDLFLPLILH